MEQDSTAQKETILVVDDDINCRQLICEILSAQGYTILEAGNGVEALKKCGGKSDGVHLLLTDVVMPQMDGATLAETLRKQMPELKVIFTSGFSTEKPSTSPVDEEFNFLEKPYHPLHLIEKVANVLRSPKLS